MPTAPADGIAALEELRGWQSALRAQFPIITGHPDVTYLDSAATAQKPQAVLDAVHTYLSTSNANAGRGTYTWANQTTTLVRETGRRIKEFLHDSDPEHSGVHFVSGTTEGLRTVARDWLASFLGDGDEIVVPFADHQANILPWLEVRDLLARQGVRILVRPMPYQSPSGDYDLTALDRLVTERTRFVAASHVHHVYGGDMNIHRIRRVVGPRAAICLDAAQSVGHLPVSLTELDVDFAVFSGHKALALPGSGAIWARNRRGPRFVPGGWSGSPNTTGIVSLRAALDWLDAAGTDRIERWTRALASRLTDGLRRLPAYEIIGCQSSLAADTTVQRRQGIVTFRHCGIDSGDLGFVLFSHGFMLRSDSHCQGSAGEKQESVRVSLHVYNTTREIDQLLAALATLE
ncbi:aminotransferase class V-fold PLP-dependent enzyme [Streptomyces sp. NPDC050844]|uniref:aminotransferase class V-fold PLP-dependent enzyme n=1 Tax=Streptomyces sp. NPDC050844 TaxID=3155790 RepID=UPI00340BDF43